MRQLHDRAGQRLDVGRQWLNRAVILRPDHARWSRTDGGDGPETRISGETIDVIGGSTVL
jgi:hypothetical protein